jgi:hypothetical protein
LGNAREYNKELTRTRLSPYERKDIVAESLISILSIMGEKSLIKGLVVPIDRHWHVKGIVPSGKLKI